MYFQRPIVDYHFPITHLENWFPIHEVTRNCQKRKQVQNTILNVIAENGGLPKNVVLPELNFDPPEVSQHEHMSQNNSQHQHFHDSHNNDDLEDEDDDDDDGDGVEDEEEYDEEDDNEEMYDEGEYNYVDESNMEEEYDDEEEFDGDIVPGSGEYLNEMGEIDDEEWQHQPLHCGDNYISE